MEDKKDLVCTRCGSLLIQSAKVIRQSANPLYPITITSFRCINVVCQQEQERHQAEIIQQRLEREERSRLSRNRFTRKADSKP